LEEKYAINRNTSCPSLGVTVFAGDAEFILESKDAEYISTLFKWKERRVGFAHKKQKSRYMFDCILLQDDEYSFPYRIVQITEVNTCPFSLK
jgi:hypothetical protein